MKPSPALLLGALLCAAAAAVQAVEPLDVVEVADGVWVHRGRIDVWGPAAGGDVANLGFVVGRRCVAVVDSGGTPALGAALRAAVARATPVPVCYVIATHAHPDHLLGQAAFADATPTPTFVAHVRLPAALAARERSWLNALRRDFGIEAERAVVGEPGLAVARSAEIDLGGRMLRLDAWPTAHTDNDLTVYDARTRTLFASDLLFVEHIPVVDGSLRGWLRVIADLRRIDVAVVVPGHGAPTRDWAGALDAEERYLGALLAGTRAALKARQTIGQAVATVGADAASGWKLAEAFHRRNVTAAYAELEWEE